MARDTQVMDIERTLWSNNALFHNDHLIEEALLVFPETGVITRDRAVDAVLAEHAEGRRWAEVQFDDVRSVQLTEEVTVLTYRGLRSMGT